MTEYHEGDRVMAVCPPGGFLDPGFVGKTGIVTGNAGNYDENGRRYTSYWVELDEPVLTRANRSNRYIIPENYLVPYVHIDVHDIRAVEAYLADPR